MWQTLKRLFKPDISTKLVKMRNKGLTQEQIARELNIPVNRVKTLLRPLLISGVIPRKKTITYKNNKIKKVEETTDQIVRDAWKRIASKHPVVDVTLDPSTIKAHKKDWVSKYNINVPAFIDYYLHHTCKETEKKFGLPKRVASFVANQLGIRKNKPYAKIKIRKKDNGTEGNRTK